MNTAEEAFYSHLTDVDSLDVMVKEGFTSDLVREAIPTELGRKITAWSIEQYFKTDRKTAPDRDAIEATWPSEMQAVELKIHDDVENNSVQWAIDQLRTDFVDWQAQEFVKAMSRDVRQADPDKRPEELANQAQLLHLLSQVVIGRKNEMDAAEGLYDALRRYDERLAQDHKYEGIIFGLPEIDDHTLGIHSGELGIFCGTSGGGKSWVAGSVLLQEFVRGRRSILFTLENDVEMTYDRLACLYCKVDYGKWQRSECNEGDVQRVRAFLTIMEKAPNRPIVCQPDEKEATGVAMVRRAVVEECDSLIIDQLSHIEPVAGSRARQRNEIVAEIVKDLYKQVKRSGAKKKVACLLLHQISREGRKNARATGRYTMSDLGEATQVENAADIIIAIYQSPDHEVSEWAEFQMLKGRRVPCKRWELEWRPAMGHIEVRREMNDDD